MQAPLSDMQNFSRDRERVNTNEQYMGASLLADRFPGYRQAGIRPAVKIIIVNN
jgi:hypothetical protein